jgi:phenylacetate-CoA ligase
MSFPDSTSGLNRLLAALGPNRFYAEKLVRAQAPERIGSGEEFAAKIPFTTKAELVDDCLRNPPFGSNFTAAREAYSRFCQSSGTSAGPLPTLDTPASWSAMLDVWDKVFDHAGVEMADVLFFAFSFGPFLGFWTAFDAAVRRGHLSIPGGGMGSRARLEMMARYGATVLCCTPTYALRLGEVLAEEMPELRSSLRVRRILVAGEPGGSIPETRAQIASLWNGAAVCDHHGMTETGPVSYESRNRPGSLLVDAEAFHAEVIDPVSGEPSGPGEMGELVLTTLRRIDRPLLRYRTGDLVQPEWSGDGLRLRGGILGRSDDMLVVRGVNVYPSALESVLRRFPEVTEFQVRHRTWNAMTELEVIVETTEPELAGRIQVALANAFALRIPVLTTAPGTLPRPEFKSQRWIPG